MLHIELAAGLGFNIMLCHVSSEFQTFFTTFRAIIFSVVMTLSLRSSEYNVQALRGRYLNLGMASN